MGPSASEAALRAAEDQKMVELVANLQKVKIAVEDPSLKSILQTVAPQLLELFPQNDEEVEVADAENGRPAPSRPNKRSRVEKPTSATVPPAPKAAPAVAPTPVEAPPTSPPAPSPTSVADASAESGGDAGVKSESKGSDPAAITSSTHRREHARLTRRMERIDPVQFPNMAKLWSGTRKDWLYVREIKFYNKCFLSCPKSLFSYVV